MKAYLDTSVIIPLLTLDAHTFRARQFLIDIEPILWISDFAAAEFASVIARRVRTGIITERDARQIFQTFDTWVANHAQRIDLEPGDAALAQSYIRRLDLTLLAPDALHIALAHRAGATLLTFDNKMAASALALGLKIADTTP